MPDLYRVNIVSTGVAGSPYYTTFHFIASAGSASQAATDATGFWGVCDSYMINTLTWDLDTAVETIDSNTGNVIGVTDVSPASGTGAAAGDMLPPATQGLVRWRTGQYVGGREIRGKTFLPAMLEANSTSGEPTSTMITGVENAALALWSSPNSQLCIYSRTYNAYAPVQSGSMWGRWAVLRSRRD